MVQELHEGLFYRKEANDRVQCMLCPKFCNLAPEQKGFCRIRTNENGKLYTLNYGKISSYGLDPIEKKPLYHFMPGSKIFSLGTYGCNLGCGFCQNWSIAHGDPQTLDLSAEGTVDWVLQKGGEDNIGIAYTYSEPLMWYEFVLETAKIAKKRGLKNVLVTNGFINEEPLKELLPYINALNIDVKGFTLDYYHKICKGDLEPVLRSVELAAKKCHVEITTLLVTGLNDSQQEIKDLGNWLKGVNKNIPLHLTRYFPNYKLDIKATPMETMLKAWQIAKEELDYVYLGNVIIPEANNTVCPNCGEILIKRDRYTTEILGLEEEKCKYCRNKVL